MTTFSYSSGNPANLVGGATASMADISGPFADLVAFLNGNIDATNIAAGGVDVAELASTLAAFLGVSQSGAVRRGKSIIATEEGRTNTAYGKMTTPDQVSNVVLPTDGLILVAYQAMWKESVDGAARAAIFFGANQLVYAPNNSLSLVVAEAPCQGNANVYSPLATGPAGLIGAVAADTNAYPGDTTTGQLIGTTTTSSSFNLFGGPCHAFAAAGTYDISVQFKASSGTVTAKERKLWVWTLGF